MRVKLHSEYAAEIQKLKEAARERQKKAGAIGGHMAGKGRPKDNSLREMQLFFRFLPVFFNKLCNAFLNWRS